MVANSESAQARIPAAYRPAAPRASRDRASPFRGLTIALIGAVVLFVCARGVSGAFTLGPPPAIVLVATVFVATAILAARPVRQMTVPWEWRAIGELELVPTAVVILSGVALWPLASWPIKFLALLVLVTEEVAWWWGFDPRVFWSRLDLADPSVRRTMPRDRDVDDDIWQQCTRFRNAGGERIHAVARVEFAPGERSRNLHLAFCPPLAAPAALTAEQRSGPAATLHVAESREYGVRIEVRLTGGAASPADSAGTVAGSSQQPSVLVEIYGQAASTPPA